MNKLIDSSLNTINRFSHQPGPVNTLLNEIVDRFIPKATVQACGGTFCKHECIVVRCGHYDTSYRSLYAANKTQCSLGNYNCIVSVCGGC